MNTKNNKRAQDTKKKIKNAYLTLIHNESDNKVSVQNICITAQINRSTFYSHYLDIFDLIEKLQIEIFTELKDILYSSYAFDINSLTEIFEQIFQFIFFNKEFYLAYLKNNSTYSFLNITNHEPFNSLIYSSGKKLGYKNKKEIDYHLRYFLSGFGGIIRLWLESNCEETPKKMAKIIEDEYKNVKFEGVQYFV